MTTAISVNGSVPLEDWESYVRRHPEGTFCHLPQWRDVLAETMGHHPYYLFATGEDGKLRGLLPLFHIKSRLTGNRLVSLPLSYICGPIADSPEVVSQLAQAAQELCASLSCRGLELRMIGPAPLGLITAECFSTHILELSSPKEVWGKLHQKGVRWAIGKAQRDGVTVVADNSFEALKTFDLLNQQTKRRLGVPGHPLPFFESMLRKLGDSVSIYIAYLDKRPIAGIMNISYKDTVCYAYAASDTRFRACHGNDLLIWKAIEDACEKGYRYFDFGKTSKDDAGLTRFKKHWGTTEKELNYCFHPRVPSTMTLNRTGMKYKLITAIWRRLPLAACRALSPMAFRHLD